jgi:hypothetical protein
VLGLFTEKISFPSWVTLAPSVQLSTHFDRSRLLPSKESPTTGPYCVAGTIGVRVGEGEGLGDGVGVGVGAGVCANLAQEIAPKRVSKTIAVVT